MLELPFACSEEVSLEVAAEALVEDSVDVSMELSVDPRVEHGVELLVDVSAGVVVSPCAEFCEGVELLAAVVLSEVETRVVWKAVGLLAMVVL